MKHKGRENSEAWKVLNNAAVFGSSKRSRISSSHIKWCSICLVRSLQTCFLFFFFAFFWCWFFFYNSVHILLESAATYIQVYTVMHRLVRFKFGFLCGKKEKIFSRDKIDHSSPPPPDATNIVKYTSVW